VCVELNICFTDPDYRRKGAGALMMRWGCDLADRLFLPGWIEASPEGTRLYREFGFYAVEETGGELGGVYMKRDPKG
jgi:GNAT superfamily N-acetyltransferase